MLNQACIEVKCKITKANGQTPDPTKKVWPVNNTLHSLFSIVRVYLNEHPIVPQPEHYPYKAYLASLLSYSNETKNAQLACQGYYSDISHHLGTSEEDYLINSGHQMRLRSFRKGEEDTTEYKTDGVKYFGRLYLDLNSAECGLIPGTKVQIQLVKSPHNFVLLKQAGDNENYKINIEECNLYVPIAQVSAPAFNEISTILTRKSVSMHYRRTEVRPITIPKDKIEFNSDILFASEIPCRIVLCFVNEEARKGNYEQNPFDFKRHWVVPAEASANISLTKEEELEKELQSMKDVIRELQEVIQHRVLREEDSTEQQTSTSFLKRLSASFIGDRRVADEEQSEASDRPPAYSDGPDPPPIPPKTKTVFIKKVELTLNNAPLDMVRKMEYKTFAFYTTKTRRA